MRAPLNPERWPRGVFPLVLVLLVAGVAVLDYTTGPEIGVSVFYILPVSMAAWFHSRRLGIAVSFGSAAAWFLCDAATRRVDPGLAVTLWNAGVRLGFFIALTLSVAALRRATRRQEEVISFIVHDLRSPLVATELALEELAEEIGPSASARALDMLETARASGGRMVPLIDSLLEVPRLERGKLAVRKAQTPVRRLVESAIGHVALWARTSEVEITARVAPEPECIWADEELTTRVLVNLLGNAIKHSPAGSTITVDFAVDEHGRDALSVADEGAGIPEEWANRAFDKYAQAESWHNGVTLGMGLGLTFCRLAVQAQGGRIRLTSAEGQGTTVTFTLPRAPRNGGR